MGLVVRGYGKTALVRECESVEKDWKNDFTDSESMHMFLRPAPRLPQAEGLKAGIYSYERYLEAPIGSAYLLSELQARLSALNEAPLLSEAEPSAWKTTPLGGLLYLPEIKTSERGAVVLGPEACLTLAKDLDGAENPAYWELPMPYFHAFLSFQRAARVASYESGFLVVTFDDDHWD